MCDGDDQHPIVDRSVDVAKRKLLDGALSMDAVGARELHWFGGDSYQCRIHGVRKSLGRLRAPLYVPVERFVEIAACAGEIVNWKYLAISLPIG